MKKIYSVEEYIEENSHYGEELKLIRSIINKTELVETIKWSAPTYMLNGKNVVGFSAFKNHFGLWFYNGVFLKDKHNLLINAQENKTKALRQMRFTHKDQINEAILLEYIKEAIENQRIGKEIKPTRNTKPIKVPAALEHIFKDNKDVSHAFKLLTPGKQREYCEYISTAKREATKLSRIEKILPMILNGVGLNDKYKNC
ncbi:YdeI/OmpD-associated family protein [Winogradskyella vincentii]|uniref:YdeI/OmpD-associated family protein n=1 Tax=Winogradskyella vincentii TaxID=2877122 RepID=A0ABS7Y220_9FLAO|nr:DUF1801 domain-containing protein [Winogradskyella vincentii]MCA0153300.1 YdeI/OmpD-associated family protein [Winogradskyella vincentii]